MRDASVRVAPDPDQFDASLRRVGMVMRWRGGPTGAPVDRSPTLIIVWDTDFVPLAHAADMLRLVPDASWPSCRHHPHE